MGGAVLFVVYLMSGHANVVSNMDNASLVLPAPGAPGAPPPPVPVWAKIANYWVTEKTGWSAKEADMIAANATLDEIAAAKAQYKMESKAAFDEFMNSTEVLEFEAAKAAEKEAEKEKK